jgi:hypothetical protein
MCLLVLGPATLVQLIACSFSLTLHQGFVEKFADVKVRGPAGMALLAIGESIGINTVSLRVCAAANGHKSPKVQSETLGWLTEALTAFGTM